jgi:hypothetical protein
MTVSIEYWVKWALNNLKQYKWGFYEFYWYKETRAKMAEKN